MTVIDLCSSYQQIPPTPESNQYTAFSCSGKANTYQVRPFGLKTVVASFTRSMDVIEVQEFTVNYIDD